MMTTLTLSRSFACTIYLILFPNGSLLERSSSSSLTLAWAWLATTPYHHRRCPQSDTTATDGIVILSKHFPSSSEQPARRRCASFSILLQNSPKLLSSSQLSMSNLWRGGGGGGGGVDTSKQKQQLSLPRDVKDAVSQCREATQQALQKRISRMDVEFPVGTKFQVEATPKRNNKRQGKTLDAAGTTTTKTPTRDDLHRSDRELARLFVDMFQPVGGQNICTVFCDVERADAAKTKWKGDASAECRILSVDRRRSGGSGAKKTKNKVPKARGFAAKLAAEVGDNDSNNNEASSSSSSGPFQLPENTEVALFVAPGPKELVVVEKVAQQVGMGTLIVLLNARLSTITNFGTAQATTLFMEEFETVFHLAAAPQEAAPNGLLFRAYPGNWVLARKPGVGPPQTVLAKSEERPTFDECQEAFASLEISDLERGVENVVQNIANWFN